MIMPVSYGFETRSLPQGRNIFWESENRVLWIIVISLRDKIMMSLKLRRASGSGHVQDAWKRLEMQLNFSRNA